MPGDSVGPPPIPRSTLSEDKTVLVVNVPEGMYANHIIVLGDEVKVVRVTHSGSGRVAVYGQKIEYAEVTVLSPAGAAHLELTAEKAVLQVESGAITMRQVTKHLERLAPNDQSLNRIDVIRRPQT